MLSNHLGVQRLAILFGLVSGPGWFILNTLDHGRPPREDEWGLAVIAVAAISLASWFGVHLVAWVVAGFRTPVR